MGKSLEKTLILGADSSIGRALDAYFSGEGVSVLRTSRKDQGDRLALDLENWRESEVANVRKATVYFCAGITNTTLCREQPSETWRVNVEATTSLIDALERNGCKVLFLSTNMVFDGSRAFSGVEGETNPKTEYGRQKQAVERWIISRSERSVIVRLGKVLGPDLQLFSDWAESLRAGSKIEAYSDWRFSPVLLCEIPRLLEKCMQEKHRRVFHLSSKGDISYFEAGRLLAEWLGCDPGCVIERKIRESAVLPEWIPQNVSLDCSWEEERFDWHYARPWDTFQRFLGRTFAP